MTLNKALFSSKYQGWGTPPELWKSLRERFDFKLDAATTEENPLGTQYYYTQEMDGLDRSNIWVDVTYVNPPYGKGIANWVKRAYDERIHGVTTVMFMPARVDTKWFHEYIYHKDGVDFTFLKGRYSMFDYRTNSYSAHVAPFPSMLVTFWKVGN